MTAWDRGTALAAILSACALTGVAVDAQMATADRLDGATWWPTKATASRADYVGPATCARCHAAHAATQPTTSMARTARPAAESDVLRAKPLEFMRGAYSYRITHQDGTVVFTVSDGRYTRSADLLWAFGAGRVGQTFLFGRDGSIYEARVSYFDTLRGLDFTPARALEPRGLSGVEGPRDVEEAMGRMVPPNEARRCFGCHTTAWATAGRLEMSGLTPGVTCEACHGPGRTHVTAIERGRLPEGRAGIFNPRSFDAVDSVDFCGACHATYWDVKLAGGKGTSGLRSQPYRLQSSRCWGEGDRRITCVACHDPHKPLSPDARSYDARCLSCHVGTGARPTQERHAKGCTTGRENCATCHMRKYEVPEMHFAFTDHLIAR